MDVVRSAARRETMPVPHDHVEHAFALPNPRQEVSLVVLGQLANQLPRARDIVPPLMAVSRRTHAPRRPLASKWSCAR
jgi:hypothetical protein